MRKKSFLKRQFHSHYPDFFAFNPIHIRLCISCGVFTKGYERCPLTSSLFRSRVEKLIDVFFKNNLTKANTLKHKLFVGQQVYTLYSPSLLPVNLFTHSNTSCSSGNRYMQPQSTTCYPVNTLKHKLFVGQQVYTAPVYYLLSC